MADRPRSGLATQVAIVTTGVAVVAVLLAGLVSISLVRGAAERQARDALGREADGIVALANHVGVLRALPSALVATGDTRIVRIRPTGGVLAPGDTAAIVTNSDISQVLAGQSVSTVRRVGGRRWFVEGRPLPTGGGLELLQPASVASGPAGDVRRRTVFALLAGLAGGALAGVLLSRRLARPLQHAAAAARRMATGARDVRLTPEGPAEVAAVAESLNSLSNALSVSEGRQREFLLSISHELRTPLTAIKGFAEALSDGVVAGQQVPETGTVMLGEATRLERIVSDLLDLARLGAHDFRIDVEGVDLTQLMRDAAAVWQARCSDEGVELRLELADAVLPIRTDPTRVRQIVDGLSENALRVTPAGSPIVLAARREGSTAVVQVRDGGPGLTADDLAVAFERSALYDRYRGLRRVGTGVGLALVAGLAARLGGTAQAGSAPEGGASFTIRLPLQHS